MATALARTAITGFTTPRSRKDLPSRCKARETRCRVVASFVTLLAIAVLVSIGVLQQVGSRRLDAQVTQDLSTAAADLRARLGQDMSDFTAAFADGVADPTTGRIGYQLTDPVAGAQLALRQQLPFASCKP